MGWIMPHFTLSMISPWVFLAGLVCSLLSIYLLASLLWSLVSQHAKLKSQQYAENLKRAMETEKAVSNVTYLRTGNPVEALAAIKRKQFEGWQSDGVWRD
jgi:hypothetical protein